MDSLAHEQPPEDQRARAMARPQLDLELRGIRKRYGDFTAVDGVSLKVPKGQFVCLLGPSGCGKTTTLRCIAGLEEPDDGDILIGGKEATRDPPWERDIAMMFQDFALFPHMTVAKNVAFGLEMLKKPKAVIAERVKQVLKSFEIAALADRKPGSLSGGQRQRVALARAMITEPRILLLDEPIGALDYSLRETVMLELKLLQQRTGISFIWVTHDQNEAFSLGDLVVVMNHARIEQQGPPEEILQRPATAFVASFVQGNNVFHGKVLRAGDGLLMVETAAGSFLVPGSAAVGDAVSFSVRAELITDQPSDVHLNQVTARCTAVEYFGALRRHVFERSDGEVLKYDQFGAHAARIATAQMAVLGWRPQDTVLHMGSISAGTAG
jgi:ABC-type Fe3+/spermidine/putrescine transport system ATPase subunit